MQHGMQKEKIIVLVWGTNQDRAYKSAQHLNAPLYNIHTVFFRRNYRLLVPLRYLVQAFSTWRLLFQKRPEIIHVTNPPIFAPLCVFLYCRLTGAAFVMDTHSPALYSRKWSWILPLQRAMARAALVNIVDQERFKDLFEGWGARAIILTKPPAKQRPTQQRSVPTEPGKFIVTVVNTFGPDEPLLPILEAAQGLPDTHFYITGDTDMADKALIASAPPNVTFTGYLYRETYWDQLIRSNTVLTLTTYHYSLLAGGQDGMVVGKPVILSRQPVLTDYFTKGAVFIDNTAEGIIAGVTAARQNEDRLHREIMELSEEKRQEWTSHFQELRKVIGAPLEA
jgi:glycosyltransferase involved in cell wall biosynthesis